MSRKSWVGWPAAAIVLLVSAVPVVSADHGTECTDVIDRGVVEYTVCVDGDGDPTDGDCAAGHRLFIGHVAYDNRCFSDVPGP